MRTCVAAFMLLGLSSVFGMPVVMEPAKNTSHGLMVGAIHKGRIVTARCDYAETWLLCGSSDKPQSVTRLYLFCGYHLRKEFPLRWKLSGESVLLIRTRNAGNALAGYRDFDVYSQSIEKLPLEPYERLNSAEGSTEKYTLMKFRSADQDLLGFTYARMRDKANSRPFFYDVMPLDEKTYHVFLLGQGNIQVEVEQSTPFISEPDKPRNKRPVAVKEHINHADPVMAVWQKDKDQEYCWSIVETIKPEFDEPFVVYSKGTNYFFVTESGKLYLSRKVEKGERKMEPLWTDDKQPIVAILDDQNSGKTFVFGQGPRGIINTKDFFFQLDEKPQLQTYDPSELKPAKAEEPLKTVVQFAQLLAERQKVKK